MTDATFHPNTIASTASHTPFKPIVSLRRCAAQVSDRELVEQTEAAILELGNLGEPLILARSIAMKINAGIHRTVLMHGKQTELTDPAVIEGTVRALRRITDAEILIGDAPTDGDAAGLYQKLGLPERLAPYAGVRLVDFNASEVVEVQMKHSGAMFQRYWLPREVAAADVVVSVAKMKAHASMGCTLCIKNLFGWMPTEIYGAPRMYLHDRLIRLPRVLSDMAQWMRPGLNVIDGTAALNKREWDGEVLTPGVVLAGTNIVATDSVGARVMGFDPCGDFPSNPFLYRRNVIDLAAAAGLGPNRKEDIRVLGETTDAVQTAFEVQGYAGQTRRGEQLQRGAACVAAYRERQDEWAARFHERYLAFFDGELLWDGPDMQTMMRLEHESGRDWKLAPQFVVRCVAPEQEIENFDWYEHEAAFATTTVCA